MEFVNRIQSFLSRPFPEYESLSSYLKTVVLISLFITFFLYQFQPNGVSSIESNKFLICIGFGVICFLSCILYEFFLIKILRIKGEGKTHTFGKWILEILGLILTISLFNFLYIRCIVFGYIDWRMLPSMIYGTMTIGIFPVAALGALAMIKQERKYESIAQELNESSNLESNSQVTFVAPSNIVLFGVNLNQIKYVESLQNYVKVAYLDANDELQIITERKTLKHIQDQAQGTSLVKCHRSYLVNREAIESVSGNAQGLLLTLTNSDKEIPVSRSFVKGFRV